MGHKGSGRLSALRATQPIVRRGLGDWRVDAAIPQRQLGTLQIEVALQPLLRLHLVYLTASAHIGHRLSISYGQYWIILGGR